MKRLHKTLADYVAIAISPALIMVLVASLVFFLAAVFYQGSYPARLNIVLGLFIFSSVLIARISIEQGRARAAPFAAVLALVVAFALFRFVEYSGAIPPGLSMVVNLILMVVVWLSADKLTHDCTVIDEDKKSSSEGLMQTIGLDDEPARDDAKPANSAGDAATVRLSGTTSRKQQEVEKPRSWWERNVDRKGRPHAPGLWVVYFSLAALPIFGFGQGLIPSSDVETRRWAFWLFCSYLAAGLGLLISTSFLGLRRYLRQRQVEMPSSLAGWWLVTGALLVLGLLVVTALLPRPAAEYDVSSLSLVATSPVKNPSNFAVGGEGVETKNSGSGSNSSKRKPSDNAPTRSGDNNSSNARGNQQGGQQSSQGNSGDSGSQNSQSQSSSQSGGQQKSSQQNDSDSQQQGNQQQGNQQQGNQSNDQSSGSQGDQSSGNQQSGGQDSQGDQSNGGQSGGDQQGNQSQTGDQSGDQQQNNSGQDSSDQGSSGQSGGAGSSSDQQHGEQQVDGQQDDANNSNASGNDNQSGNNSSQQQSGSNSSGGGSSSRSAQQQNPDENPDESGGEGESDSDSGGSGLGSGSSFAGDSSAAADTPDISEGDSWFSDVDWLTTGFKWLIFLVVGLVILFVLIRYGKEILRGFREFFANLGNFLARLLGGGKRETAKAGGTSAEDKQPKGPPPRPFSSYADPFSSGMADKVPPKELVRYSFEAFEAWARDHGRPRGEEETPYEFANDVARSSGKVAKHARNLADLYDRAAYAPGDVTPERAMSLSGLWNRLRGGGATRSKSDRSPSDSQAG